MYIIAKYDQKEKDQGRHRSVRALGP